MQTPLGCAAMCLPLRRTLNSRGGQMEGKPTFQVLMYWVHQLC